MSWCTVESDPGVFTELIRNLGVEGVQVEELYDLDLDHLLSLQPVYGLIFLFKWEKDDDVTEADGRQLLTDEAQHRSIFFARQIVQNACATQAIVSVLLNRPEVRLGEGLASFKDFALELPAEMRGEALGNSDFIRKAHNAFARPEPFVFEEKKDEGGEGEDAFHFIGYVPVQGELLELDGLKPAPITLGKVEGGSEGVEWLSQAKLSIERRVQKYAEKEIRFNLLALVRTPRDKYQEQLQDIRTRRTQVQQRMGAQHNSAAQTGAEAGEAKMEDTTPTSSSSEQLSAGDGEQSLLRLEEEEREVQQRLADEEQKLSRWRTENARRQHNYVPFIFQLLKLLAEKGKLQEVVDSAAKVTAEKNAKLLASRQKKKDEAKEDKAKATAMNVDSAAAQADTKPK